MRTKARVLVYVCVLDEANLPAPSYNNIFCQVSYLNFEFKLKKEKKTNHIPTNTLNL